MEPREAVKETPWTAGYPIVGRRLVSEFSSITGEAPAILSQLTRGRGFLFRPRHTLELARAAMAVMVGSVDREGWEGE